MFFPAGRFLCGTLVLKNHVTLYLTNTPEGIGFEMVDGGTLERITLSNITIEGVHAPLFMRLGNRARKHTPEAPAPPRHGHANGLTCRQN